MNPNKKALKQIRQDHRMICNACNKLKHTTEYFDKHPNQALVVLQAVSKGFIIMAFFIGPFRS
jgi:hypothetical protein